MRLALQLARYISNTKLREAGKFPSVLKGTTEQVFNLGTIQGARAVKMDKQTGSLTEGKFADIVIFNANSPAMICAAEQDPLVAVVRHSSIRDIDTVIVDGIVRKESGHLVPITVESKSLGMAKGSKVAWEEIAKKLVRSREVVTSKVDKLDMEVGRKGLIKKFYIDPGNFEQAV